MSRIRLVVFDLDGTLIDSRRDLARATNDVLARHGAGPLGDATLTAMVGDGARVLLERAFREAALPPPAAADLDAFLEAYHEHLFDTTRPYEGVDDTLARVAAACRAAVLTNKPLAHTTRLIAHFGWGRWLSVVAGGDGPLPRKPAPDGLRDVMARAGEGPAATLVVGDSRVDLATARAAGTRFALARYGFGAAGVAGAALGEADWVLDAPADLVPKLAAS